MRRSGLPPRRRAAATALTTVSLVLAGLALPAAPAAAATTLPPWTSPVTLSGEASAPQDVVVRSDGSAVAVWIKAASGRTGRLLAALRPAGSDTWSAPVELAAASVGEARIVARSDGSVAAVWAEYSSPTSSGTATGPSRVVAAVLGAGQAPAWSQPVELVGTAKQLTASQLDLAQGPDGTVAAVWVGRPQGTSVSIPSEAYATTLAADGSWTAPVRASNAGSYSGSYYGAVVFEPQIASDAQGGLVVSYRMHQYGISYLMTNTRPAGATDWQTPVKLTDDIATDIIAKTTNPTLASDAHGVVLVWQDKNKALRTMRRPDAATDWSPAQTAATDTGYLYENPEPLLGPDGDVTLVWTDATTYSLRTTTFDAATGQWSATRTLSTTPVMVDSSRRDGHDAAIAPDGSVHVLWHQDLPDEFDEHLLEATLVDGEWTAPRQIDGNTRQSVTGEIAATSATDATAVWTWSANGATGLDAARTTYPRLALELSSVPASVNFKSTAAWAPTWQANSPVTSWTLTLTDAAGRTLRTLTGAPGTTTVAASWNGRTASGAWVANGKVNWTLKAAQSGYSGTPTLASGTLTVAGGAPVPRDFGGVSALPDGVGDLLTLTSTGRLQLRYGTLNSVRELGAGWPTTIRAVPFGDLSGDRCNDVLVRLSSGALRLYKPACGGALTPTTSYTTLATSGWNQYDVLTAPGDLTKDGLPDLLARNASTGAVYLYKGTSTGRLSAPVKLYDSWKTYKKVVGAGDLNGDGIGDLLAQDNSNNLYRYLGTGTGTFTARVKLYANWGASYNLVVGAGDVTGDRKADLVARDTAGVLYRLPGTGTGGFGTRVKIGTGWGAYKGVF
ncbi:FG-GAP-like repeat-containing protein [Streptomyces sp. NEAU-NA10]|uniref:FG-GAP repeat domain-containing protein n=1 Tax=Streptomyces sp. NEAU-NA10 TaxID=3416050 RepID=UPI003CC6C522